MKVTHTNKPFWKYRDGKWMKPNYRQLNYPIHYKPVILWAQFLDGHLT